MKKCPQNVTANQEMNALATPAVAYK